MFRPMAITVCSALLGSLILALTVVPAATALVFRKPLPRAQGSAGSELCATAMSSLVHWVLRHRAQDRGRGRRRRGCGALGSLAFIGTEFMPRLDEGSILIETRKLPGISLTESVAMSTQSSASLKPFPEVTSVVTKLGRPDVATEAMGIYQGDVYVLLKPREQWTRAKRRSN